MLLAVGAIALLNGVVLNCLVRDGDTTNDANKDEDNTDNHLSHTPAGSAQCIRAGRRSVTDLRGLDNRGQDTTQVLDKLVETSKASSLVGIVGESSHQPVRVALVHGIGNTIEEVQEEGCNVIAGVLDEINAAEVGGVLDVLTVLKDGALGSEGGLEGNTASPGGSADGGQQDETIASTSGAGPLFTIQESTVEDRGKDLSHPVEHRVHVTGALSKVEGVDSGELVGVDPVGGEEHGNECQHAPVLEESKDRLELRDGARVLDLDDGSAIVTNDLGGGQQQDGDESTDGHDNHVSDISAIGSTTSLWIIPLKTERNHVSEDTTAVEDGPEDGEVLALLVLSGVTHHDGTLGAPQPTSTNTQQAGGDDDKDDRVNRVVGQERSDVEDIGQTTENEEETMADNVEECSSEQGREGEHNRESGTGVVTDI